MSSTGPFQRPSPMVKTLTTLLEGFGLVCFLRPPDYFTEYFDGQVLGFYQPDRALIISVQLGMFAGEDALRTSTVRVSFSGSAASGWYNYRALGEALTSRVPLLARDYGYDVGRRIGALADINSRYIELAPDRQRPMALPVFASSIVILRDLILGPLPLPVTQMALDASFKFFDASCLDVHTRTDPRLRPRFFGQPHVRMALSKLRMVVSKAVRVSPVGIYPGIDIWGQT